MDKSSDGAVVSFPDNRRNAERGRRDLLRHRSPLSPTARFVIITTSAAMVGRSTRLSEQGSDNVG